MKMAKECPLSQNRGARDLNLRNKHHRLLSDFIDMETEARRGWSRSHTLLGTELVPTVRTTLFPLLTPPSTTTFNFSSSHIQLALSRNVIVPTPSVHPSTSFSLFSASQASICCTVLKKNRREVRGFKLITICLSSRQPWDG